MSEEKKSGEQSTQEEQNIATDNSVQEDKNENIDETTDNVEDNQKDETSNDNEENKETEDTEDNEKEQSEDEQNNSQEPATPATVAQGDPHQIIEEARRKVQEVDSLLHDEMISVEKDLKTFKEYEEESLTPVINETKKLMAEAGVSEDEIGELAVPPVELDGDDDEKLYIDDISSGKGGAFFAALVGGAVTVGAWYGFLLSQGAVTEHPKEFNMETLSPIFDKLASLIGLGGGAEKGAGVVIISALIVMWIIYAIKVKSKAKKNIEIAAQKEQMANEYCTKKEECKNKMEAIREHLNAMHNTAQKFAVLLDEKNASIKRAFYFEGKVEFDKYHALTQKEINEAKELINQLEKLLSTPVARAGVLTEEAKEVLEEANRYIDSYLEHIYKA